MQTDMDSAPDQGVAAAVPCWRGVNQLVSADAELTQSMIFTGAPGAGFLFGYRSLINRSICTGSFCSGEPCASCPWWHLAAPFTTCTRNGSVSGNSLGLSARNVCTVRQENMIVLWNRVPTRAAGCSEYIDQLVLVHRDVAHRAPAAIER